MKLDETIKILKENQDVLQKYFVKDLYIFGSFARNEVREMSDIDILVDFEPDARIGIFEFIRLKRDLSDLLHCEVDLATRDSLHKALRKDILNEAVHAA
jgi:predicted nucleotidyltransferase